MWDTYSYACTPAAPPAPAPPLNKIYADVPEADKQRIWAGNAVEFFKLA
jgi:hypothetical protein